MKRRAILGTLALLAVAAGGIAFVRRDAIVMNLFTRAAEKAMARDVMAGLDPMALHVGFCGTSSPLPSRDRAAACTLVIADGKLFVFDMGEGSGEILSLMGMPLDKIQGVWLTHLHSDHFEGLGPFTLQRWAGTSAKTPLAVFGPEGVNEIADGLNAVYRIDSTFRIAHHGEVVVPPSGFGMSGAAIAPGVIYDEDGMRITAFAVDHAPVTPSYGYRVDWKGRSVTISGDTDVTSALAKAAKGFTGFVLAAFGGFASAIGSFVLHIRKFGLHFGFDLCLDLAGIGLGLCNCRFCGSCFSRCWLCSGSFGLGNRLLRCGGGFLGSSHFNPPFGTISTHIGIAGALVN